MHRIGIAVGILAAVALPAGLAGCGDDASGVASPSSSAPPSSSASSDTGDGPGLPFGPGCAGISTTGPDGSSGMSTEPFATAASTNPMLSKLADAIEKAGLTGTLDSAKDITVFAPANKAFEKIPKNRLDKLLADKKTLASILNYHVIGKRISPSGLGAGRFKTLQGATLTASGSGDSYMVGAANVLCGNVQTANATVYIIDSVLIPPT
ncbi:fasciclin domain-containing protein [Spirillospora sp. CA-142024]|uniref:fasciclin domain-containing protein n=1 Tax=Spirillospora sp. CA-142024 TaxID=3240036 RepID=UPI003D8F8A36